MCYFTDYEYCKSMLSFSDKDPTQIDLERFLVLVSYFPSGASAKSTFHYGQLINQKEEVFRRWDYGSAQDNIAHYGQPVPPNYDLKNIKFPVAFYYGGNDNIANPTDAEWTAKQLDHTIVVRKEYLKFGHLSFAMAKNMTWFSDDVIPVINRYN